jgi:hypothetical protein
MWGGTKQNIIKIVTLETGDMPQKVFFGIFWTHWRQVTGPLCQKKVSKIWLKVAPWVAVLKLWNKFFLVSYWKIIVSKRVPRFMSITEGNFQIFYQIFYYQNVQFLSEKRHIFCHRCIRKIINSLQLRRKLLRNFLLRVRSNKIKTILVGKTFSIIIWFVGKIQVWSQDCLAWDLNQENWLNWWNCSLNGPAQRLTVKTRMVTIKDFVKTINDLVCKSSSWTFRGFERLSKIAHRNFFFSRLKG